MLEHRLTICVPTFNRPEMLPRALDSALDQTVPARILIADDGDCDRTVGILRDRYGEHLRGGRIIHLRTGAVEPWENWRAGAEACETELVSWLQDDDIVCKQYVERIIYAFAKSEQLGARPHVWMACLDCADPSAQFGLHFAFNGPIFPMKTLYGVCEPCHWLEGSPLAASSYFTSHSLSPALAYRNGPKFRDALRTMPERMDVFIERLMPAEMALHGGVITDPAVVGYWRQHGSNLSRDQHPDQPRQTKLLVAHLDDLLDRIGDWQEPFLAWLRIVTPGLILGWLGQLDTTEKEGGKSRHGHAVRHLMLESLEGRVRVVSGSRRWWQRLWPFRGSAA